MSEDIIARKELDRLKALVKCVVDPKERITIEKEMRKLEEESKR